MAPTTGRRLALFFSPVKVYAFRILLLISVACTLMVGIATTQSEDNSNLIFLLVPGGTLIHHVAR